MHQRDMTSRYVPYDSFTYMCVYITRMCVYITYMCVYVYAHVQICRQKQKLTSIPFFFDNRRKGENARSWPGLFWDGLYVYAFVCVFACVHVCVWNRVWAPTLLSHSTPLFLSAPVFFSSVSLDLLPPRPSSLPPSLWVSLSPPLSITLSHSRSFSLFCTLSIGTSTSSLTHMHTCKYTHIQEAQLHILYILTALLRYYCTHTYIHIHLLLTILLRYSFAMYLHYFWANTHTLAELTVLLLTWLLLYIHTHTHTHILKARYCTLFEVYVCMCISKTTLLLTTLQLTKLLLDTLLLFILLLTDLLLYVHKQETRRYTLCTRTHTYTFWLPCYWLLYCWQFYYFTYTYTDNFTALHTHTGSTLLYFTCISTSTHLRGLTTVQLTTLLLTTLLLDVHIQEARYYTSRAYTSSHIHWLTILLLTTLLLTTLLLTTLLLTNLLLTTLLLDVNIQEACCYTLRAYIHTYTLWVLLTTLLLTNVLLYVRIQEARRYTLLDAPVHILCRER